MTFDEWMRQVNAILFRLFGVAADDMEDYTWRDEFDAESSPVEAVRAFRAWAGLGRAGWAE